MARDINAINEFIDNNTFSMDTMYIIGGSAMYLNEKVNEYPKDLDIIIQNGDWYNIETSDICIDCIETNKALLADGWEERSIFLKEYNNIVIKYLGFEDIIINRTSALNQNKHLDYVSDMIKSADMSLLKTMIESCKDNEYIHIRDWLYRENLQKLENLIKDMEE